MNDVLDGLVGLVVGGFELAIGPVGRVGLVMEAAVSKRATETLVEEQEQEGNIDTFTGQPVGIATTIALQQSMPFQLAQIVAELVEPVGFRGEMERGNDCFVDLPGGPAPEGAAVMEENLQEPDDPGVVEFDARITDRADVDGQGDPLQQGKVHMYIQALCLEAGEAVRDGLESLTDGIKMIEPFLQAEVAQVVGAEFVAQEAGELFVLLEEGMFPVRPENVMSVFDLIDHRRQFPVQPFIQPHAEDFTDAVRGQAPQADLATALEDLVDWEVAFEDEVPAVLDLRNRIEPRQTHLAAFLL